jgi:exoribonuclease-2
MIEHGFDLSDPPAVAEQLVPAAAHNENQDAALAGVQDLRQLPWSSIDNDTSRDLDQLEVAERRPDGVIRVMVAIADVDAFVPKDSPIDRAAARQTTTVYTGVMVFPMLPLPLSAGRTSLLPGEDKLAVVVEFEVDRQGIIGSSRVYRARVRSQAQLTYRNVGGWLEGRRPAPHPLDTSTALADQIRVQDEAAARLRSARHHRGALNIETIETRAVVGHDGAVTLEVDERSRATVLIEDFMIATNEAVARLLETRGMASLRRIVRAPARWDRIVALAGMRGATLPSAPDSRALNEFLVKEAARDPVRFPDLSLAVIKLMGPGEYVVERPGEPGTGHFGLAVEDYTHATAPNRRFADLVTERLVKACLAGQPSPYTDDELRAIADDCNLRASAARKVEREIGKFMAATAMRHRIGERFDAVVTGVTPKGTFVRIITPHVEGLLEHPLPGTDVGDTIHVRLVRTDTGRGYIDFAPA